MSNLAGVVYVELGYEQPGGCRICRTWLHMSNLAGVVYVGPGYE